MMDSLGMLDRSFEMLDLDLFPTTHLQVGMLDVFEDGSKDSLSDILPDILGQGFDHLSALPLDDDLDFVNSEFSDLDRDAILQEFVHEMQNTLPVSPGKFFLKGLQILGRDSPSKLSDDCSNFFDSSKIWTSQLDPISGPMLEDDDIELLTDRVKKKPALCETLLPINGQAASIKKSQGSVDSVDSDSDLDVDSCDDVDIETVDDSEMKGKSCAELLSAKLASLANDCQAARVRTVNNWKTDNRKSCNSTVPCQQPVTNEPTGYKASKSTKVVKVKPEASPIVTKPKFKLKDCNTNLVIEKIKQSSANRRGSILISHDDVLPQRKTAKSSKPKTVKTPPDDYWTTKAKQPAAEHDYYSDVIIVKRTPDSENSDAVPQVATSETEVWLECDNCMVAEEVVPDCATASDAPFERAPTIDDTDVQEKAVSSSTQSSATIPIDTITIESDDDADNCKDVSRGSTVEKDYQNCWRKERKSRSRSIGRRRKQISRWRSKRYRSSCSPSNSSSSHSVYRSCSRSPNRPSCRRRRYSRSSSRSRSRSWTRSRSRSWSRKRDCPRFKRKERRSPSPLYQSMLRQNRAYDDKGKQIDDRRVIFVGKIPDGSTKTLLRQRFGRFGPIKEVSVHFRDNGDNYGFVTFTYNCDAYEALEHGNDNVNEPKFDLCFGGRRQFCGKKYSDLDAQYSSGTAKNSISSGGMDFDSLLNAAKAQIRKSRH